MRSLVALGFALVVAGGCFAADWPMGGRTSNRNPVSLEKNAPTDWQIADEDVKPRNIRWSAKLGSRSLGGPVISGGLVWVGTNNRTAGEETIDHSVLTCLRESDGTVLYRYLSPRLPQFPDDWPDQGLSGSPLADGDRLWFCTNRREVVCLDVGPLKKGGIAPRIVWKFDMVKELGIQPRAIMIPGHDTHGSPASYKDFLYIPTGNGMSADNSTVPAPNAPSLVCMRKDTGQVIWKDNSPGKDMMPGHYSNPLVIEAGGNAQVIHPQADGWVRSFDALTGKLLWKFDANYKDAPRGFWQYDENHPRAAVVATPVYAEGRVHFGTGRDPETTSNPGRLFCIDATKLGDVSPELDDGKGKGKPNPNSAVIWEYTGENAANEADRMMYTISSVAVHDGLAVALNRNGYVLCLDAKSGEFLWSHDAKGALFGNPLVVDGKLYVATQSGTVWIFEFQRKKKLIAKRELYDTVTAPPVFANGVLYILTRNTLYAIAAKP